MRAPSDVPRRSKVILSDDEIALKIRAEGKGQPDEWVDEAVAAELAQRADLSAWAQRSYDQSAPRPYTRPVE